jgi:maltose phosphorylase
LSFNGIAFLASKSNFKRQKSICYSRSLGPNEYENNINNNFIPTILQNGVLIIRMSKFRKYLWNSPSDHKRIIEKVKLAETSRNGKSSR